MSLFQTILSDLRNGAKSTVSDIRTKTYKVLTEPRDFTVQVPKAFNSPTYQKIQQASDVLSTPIKPAQSALKSFVVQPFMQSAEKMRMQLTGESVSPQAKIAPGLYGKEPIYSFGKTAKEITAPYLQSKGISPNIALPLAVAGGVGLSTADLFPITGGGKNAAKNIGKEATKFNVAKWLAQKRLKDVIKYPEMMQEAGYPAKQILKTGVKEARQILTKEGYNVYREPWKEEIKTIVPDLTAKQKVNLVDYFRTPEDVFKKLRLGSQFKGLRTAWDSYKQELPVEIDRITKWREQVPSPQSSQKIFRYLDGKPAAEIGLDQQELKVANEIKSYLGQWADRLKLPKESRISNYITHIFDRDFIQKEFPAELSRVISEKVPSSVYDPFVQQRLGKMGYKEDVWEALSAYVKRGVRKSNIDPALEGIKNATEYLDKESYDYVQKFTSRINMRPTSFENLMDNTIKSLVGYRFGQRPTNYISHQLRQTIYRGALGINPKSALRNLTQAKNTYAKLGERYTIKGYADLIKNWKYTVRELKDVGVLEDSFIGDQNLSVFKSTLGKVDEGLFAMFSTAEKINRGAAYMGAKAKALDKGMSEGKAVEYAKDIVRQTQFTFGAIDTPLILSSDLAKTLLQFKSYSLKQQEFIANLVKNKEWAGLARYVGSTFVLYAALGKFFGTKVLSELAPGTDIVGEGGLVESPATQLASGAMGLLKSDDNDQKRAEAIKKLAETAKLFIPGGNQLFRTMEGINAVNQGASTTPSGRIRYLIDQNPQNYAKAALFGQYSLPGASEYFESRSQPKAEAVLKKLEGHSPEEQNAMMQQLKEGDKALYNDVVFLKKAELSGLSKKEIGFKNLPIKDGSRSFAISKKLKGMSVEEQNQYIQTLMELGIVNKDVLEQLKLARQNGKL